MVMMVVNDGHASVLFPMLVWNDKVLLLFLEILLILVGSLSLSMKHDAFAS